MNISIWLFCVSFAFLRLRGGVDPKQSPGQRDKQERNGAVHISSSELVLYANDALSTASVSNLMHWIN
jgi:hypothetical protein